MPDTLRVVSLSNGGRPIEILNLNSEPGETTAYFKEKGSFTYTPPAPTVQWSKTSRRYGGARAVGETHDNGSIAWTAYVRGLTLDDAVHNVEALLAAIADAARGRYVEWAPEGNPSSFLEIAGPGTWTPTYDPVEFVQTNAMRVQLVFPVLPLVEWARPTVDDLFDYDGENDVTPSKDDYIWDRGAPSNFDGAFSNNGGALVANAAAVTTGLHRVRHVARGYTFLEGQALIFGGFGSVVTGFHMGVKLRASSSNTYVEVYVDDNGTNSRLRIDVVIGGTVTNRASINFGSRFTVGFNSIFSVVGRIEGNTVYAEHYIGQYSPLLTPTLTTSYTLVSGDAPLHNTPGSHGWTFTPKADDASLYEHGFRHLYRNLTWPRTLAPSDPIPGTAPARCAVTLVPSGGANTPVFAMIGWAKRIHTVASGGTFSPVYPFGPLTAAGSPSTGRQVGVQFSSNVAPTADSTATSGFIQTGAVSGATVTKVGWTVDPTAYASDAFSANELRVEVWGRLAFSGIVNPTVILSATNQDAAYGAERFSDEWGAAGRLLSPSVWWEYRRLGTLTLPADPKYRKPVVIWVTINAAAGSSGAVYYDRIDVVHAYQRALSPSGKALDSTYPAFVSSTNVTQKTIRSDLSALVSGNPIYGTNVPMPDHGLGGSLIEPPPGSVDWFVKLASAVPDSPVPQVGNEQLTHTASIGLDYTPRSYFLRTQ